MRARKRVLLYCRDEMRCSEVSVVLKVRGFAVEQVDSAEMLQDALERGALSFDGVLVLDAGEDSRAEDAVEAIHRHTRFLLVLLQPFRQRLEVTQAERCLAHGASMQELVEAVRLLVARKRGPNQGVSLGAQRAVAMAARKVAAGKQAAGRMLDGREWNEFPEAARG